MSRHLFGLVICGGKSSRMGLDKAFIRYREKPQVEYLYEILNPFCEKVFISCNKEQVKHIKEQYNFIIDHEGYANQGPLTGILSAHDQFPEADLLVLACDYPLIGEYELELLVKSRIQNKPIAFRNEAGYIEPLISILTKQDLDCLIKHTKHYKGSLRKYLEGAETVLLQHPEPSSLRSADSQEDYHKMIQELRKQS